MVITECQCKEPGFCPVFRKQIIGRLYDICQGRSGLGAEKEQAYRNHWAGHTNGEAPKSLTVQRVSLDCEFRRDAMDGDKRKTRSCPSCRGHVEQFVFECRHPDKPKGPEVVMQECVECIRENKNVVNNSIKVTHPEAMIIEPLKKDTKEMILRFNHGLGDAVAFTVVLAHLRKAGWTIDLAAPKTYASLFAGLVRNVLPMDAPNITREVQWLEGRGNYQEWSSTKAIRCLLDEFHMKPEKELLSYQVQWDIPANEKVSAYLAKLPQRKGFVAIHYEGHVCEKKNLPVEVVAKLCSHLIEREYVPIILDWKDRPALADNQQIFNPGRGHLLWQGNAYADPRVLAALLSRMALNIGIDSGPGKLAMAVETPLITVWPGASPLHYVDSPGQDIHLVPMDHEQLMNASNGVLRHCDVTQGKAFFRSRFRHKVYSDLGKTLCETADYLLGIGGEAPVEPSGEPIIVSPLPAVRKLLLHTGLPPGDVMTMTAAVEMLHEQYPGQYLTAVSTNHPEIWENNPKVVQNDGTFEKIDMQYHAINESGNRPVHFICGYTEFLASYLGVPLKMTTNRPHLYLSDEEKRWMNQVHEVTRNPGPFWVINAGVKNDYTAKQYPFFADVVELLKGKVRFAQIGKESDRHKPIPGTVNLIGKTSDRALIRLIYHAQGVLSGVSFPMHLAAAFDKPAVIVAGGREPRLWNSYPTQILLNNVGGLDCCRHGACWKSRVLPDADGKNDSLCVRPMPTEPPAGECMTLISPELVARAIESFLS